MRVVILLLSVFSFIYAAGVNERLYNENNSSAEIRKVRAIIAGKTLLDAEEQNRISIQKLFSTRSKPMLLQHPKRRSLFI